MDESESREVRSESQKDDAARLSWCLTLTAHFSPLSLLPSLLFTTASKPKTRYNEFAQERYHGSLQKRPGGQTGACGDP